MKVLSMKVLVASIVTLFSVSSFASGFVCEGRDSQGNILRAKMYNETDPNMGTANPAVLIVSSAATGTIAALEGSEIEKINSPSTVTYQGKTNHYGNGRYVSVQLQIVKQPSSQTQQGARHFARLAVTADHAHVQANLSCLRVLKGE